MNRKGHHVVLRSEKKRVKLQSQTGNIQETMENQEEISSESMESDTKHGNSRFAQHNHSLHNLWRTFDQFLMLLGNPVVF